MRLRADGPGFVTIALLAAAAMQAILTTCMETILGTASCIRWCGKMQQSPSDTMV